MEHETTLLPDFTVFIQMGLFFASWFVLHKLVFKPYLALIEARKAKSSGLKEKALSMKEKAKELQTRYETNMKEARHKLSEWTDAERKKLTEEERTSLQNVRDEVGAELQKVREATSKEYQKARKELLPKVEEYSSVIVSKLVGYKVSVPKEFSDRTHTEETQTTV